ncbi:rod shape-determining protein RodA [bacterium]|nr:rod shape-determining protein RodA [bacterium]
MPRKKIDIFLILPIAAILFLGLLSLSSALISKFYIQLIWVVLAAVVFVFVSYSDLRMFERAVIPMYFANVILLALVLLIGKTSGGAQRWLDIGFMNFQVSELTKISVILFIAYQFNLKPTLEDGYNLIDILPEAFGIFVPVFLIYKEPDLGTAILVGAVAAAMILSTKINRRWLVGVLLFVIVSVPVLWMWGLHDYQKTRVIALVTMLLGEESQELSQTSQYHIKQSIIAVGSGRLHGKGYMRGTQNMLRFIPEHHTDFIFSVYAEEFGFFGVMLLLFLYFLLLVRILLLVGKVKDKFSALILVGSCAHIWLQVLVNIGMVTGILPVVGIPLPWFSYGGSSLIFNMLLMGLVHNVSLHRCYS